MKTLYIVFLIIFSVYFISCGSSNFDTENEIHQRTAQFIESEYLPYGDTGTSIITGQAFLKTRGGDVKYGAGCMVYLNPVTTYSTEWFTYGIIKEMSLSKADQRIDKYHWETMADGFGNFEFKNLPTGEYYLACNITWEVPGKYNLVTTGGYAYAQAKISTGETIKVIVTRK